MNRTSRCIAAGVLAAVLSLQLLAGAAQERIPVHFTVFALRPFEHVVFLPSADVEPLPLKFYPTARSPEVAYVGEMPVSFSDESGETVAFASIPPEIAKALLIFVPSGRQYPKYEIHVLDDGALRHRPGGVAFVNLSGLQLVGKLGSHAIALGPGLSSTLKITSAAELLLESQVGSRRFRSYSQSIELAPGERALLILFPPYYRASLEVQARLLIDEPPVESLPK
jgi:hypothetical protein